MLFDQDKLQEFLDKAFEGIGAATSANMVLFEKLARSLQRHAEDGRDHTG